MKSVVYNKSFEFSIEIVELYKEMCNDKEFVLSKQILRSGTSICANIKEALYAQSKKDFVSKISIALKEAAETEYWLELIYKTNYVSKEKSEELLFKCKEIIKMLYCTVRTSNESR